MGGPHFAATAICLSVQLAQERQIDVNAHDPRGDTPLLLAIRSRSFGFGTSFVLAAAEVV